MNGKEIYDKIGDLTIKKSNEEFFINVNGEIYKIKDLYFPHDNWNMITFVTGDKLDVE